MPQFKVATFNANSLRSRLPIIKTWLAKEQPDALCLQETKVQDKDFPVQEFESMGYHGIFKGQKSYNGVGIITKRPADRVRTGLYGDPDEEARFLSACIDGVFLFNVYVPQGVAPGTERFAYKLRWLKDLVSHLEKNYRPNLPILVTGDFNVALEPIDVYDPEGLRGGVGFHPDEQSAMGRLFAWGLIDVFRKHEKKGGYYTFWDYRIPNGFKRKMGWRIDYILASPPLADKSSRAWIDVAPRTAEKPSDHTFVAAEFEV